ncbi:MAG: hypothetical protein HYY24_18255 [Verrucomicrobia bacterium]|nr:hypothetical protein [Verrucomicrobiota bacterium]
MKTIAILMLFCASLYGADTSTNRTSDITSKVTERERDGGKTHLRWETVSRGKTPILRVLQTTRGGITKTSRSYEVDGKLVMIESDENGDGRFESVTLFRPGTDEMEMFTRQSDGSVKPASTKILEATKKQLATVDDMATMLFQKEDLTDEQIGDLIQETRKKIQDAEREKTNDK